MYKHCTYMFIFHENSLLVFLTLKITNIQSDIFVYASVFYLKKITFRNL